jgi:hypothetical protein
MRAVTKDAAKEAILIAAELASVKWIRLVETTDVSLPLWFTKAMCELQEAVNDLVEWRKASP